MDIKESDLEPRTDEELVKLSQEGDEEAFGALYHRYKNPLFNYLLKILHGHQADAEEALQDTFLNAYTHLSTYKEEGKFKSWLYRIATNFAYKGSNRKKRRSEVSYDAPIKQDESQDARAIPDESLRPDRLAFQNELRDKIQRNINRLSPKYREVITLCDIEGFSYKECGDALNASEKKVSVWLWRAREQLRNAPDFKDFDIKLFWRRYADPNTLSLLERMLYPKKRIRYLFSLYIDSSCNAGELWIVKKAIKMFPDMEKCMQDYTRVGIILKQYEPIAISAKADQVFFQKLAELRAALSELPAARQFADRIIESLLQIKERYIDIVMRPMIPVPVRVTAGILGVLLIVFITQVQVGKPGLQIAQVKGAAKYFDHKIEDWAMLKKGVYLKAGSRIKVEHNSLDIKFENRYALRMREGSDFTVIDVTPQESHIRVNGGQLLVKLGEEFAGSKFRVESRHFNMIALGTAFEVGVYEEYGYISCFEGVVIVDEYEIRKGERGVFVNEVLDELTLLDPVALEELTREVNLLFPGEKTTVNIPNIGAISAKLSLGYYELRVEDYFRPFSLRISGRDADIFRKSFPLNKMVGAKKINELLKADILNIEKYAINKNNPKYTPQLLIFISSVYYRNGEYEDAIRVLLEAASYKGKANWGSLALCAIGEIYKSKLNNSGLANEYYNRVDKEFPAGPEAAYLKTRK